METRVATGIKGLDQILYGGFMRHNSILLKGAPGTGKTLLGIQVLLQGIRENNEPAVICSFEEFPQQLYRDMRSFGLDLEKLVAEENLVIYFLKPEDLVAPSGSPQPPKLSRIFGQAEDRGVRRMLIDSVTHFNQVTPDPSKCRAILLDFINGVKRSGITPILTAELDNSQTRNYTFEEYLVDEVVLMHNDRTNAWGSLPQRAIEVTKSRGHAHVRGRHPFRIKDNGIEVYPRIMPAAFAPGEMADSAFEPVGSGVSGVDRMIGGGYLRGTATIVAGMSGTYKTTLAASFLAEGARKGEKGLYITFEETPQHLLKMLAKRGVDLSSAFDSGMLQIRHYVPKESYLEAIFAEIQDELQSNSQMRVVIDSLNDFERVVDDSSATEDYLGMFLAALTRAGATTLLTQKIDHATSSNPITDIRYTSMVDNVIYLGNVEIESEVRKVISILKSRSSSATIDLCEIQCGSAGLHVADKFRGLSGILQGTAQGQFKQTVEEIFQPLYFIRDFAQMGAMEGIDPLQRAKILSDILAQVTTLDSALKDHFGFDPETAKKV